MSRKRFTGALLVDRIADEKLRIAKLEKELLASRMNPADIFPVSFASRWLQANRAALFLFFAFFGDGLQVLRDKWSFLLHDVPESRSRHSSKFRVYSKTCEKEMNRGARDGSGVRTPVEFAYFFFFFLFSFFSFRARTLKPLGGAAIGV